MCTTGLPGSCFYPYQYYFDSIIHKTILLDTMYFDFVGWYCEQYWYPKILAAYKEDYPYPYTKTKYSGSFKIVNNILIDTILMPEEYRLRFSYNYSPFDSSFCLRSPQWTIDQNNLDSNFYFTFFEWAGFTRTYKSGLGLLHYFTGTVTGSPPEVDDTTLLYYNKGGVSCGEYYIPPLVTSVKSILSEKNVLHIYPNPSNDAVTIELENNTTQLQIQVFDIFGSVMLSASTKDKKYTFNVKNLPSGVYNVRVGDERENYNEKLVVEH
jgi:hypothetical protein